MVKINARCESLREQYGDNWRCEREIGHPGKHRNEQGELMWDDAPATPQRCGQVHSTMRPDGPRYTCTLAAGHFGTFHLDADQVATWSRAGDAVQHADMAAALARGPVSLQHDTCGARLTVNYPTGDIPRTTRVCALGPHDFNTNHRSADGTRWRATDFPPTAPQAPVAVEPGALDLAPILARYRKATDDRHYHSDIEASMRDVEPMVREIVRYRRRLAERFMAEPSATTRSAVDGIRRHLDDMTNMFRELTAALCTGCREVAASSNPEDGADLEIVPGCPVHGETAELRRSLDWSARQYERIALALGPEYAGPFAPDVAEPVIECIKTARRLDSTLRADAGIEHPLGLRGVDELISQRDGAREDYANASRTANIVRDMVADALPGEDRARLVRLPLPDVVNVLIEAYRELGRVLDQYR